MKTRVVWASVLVLILIGAMVLFVDRSKKQKALDRERAYTQSVKAIENLGYTLDPNELKRRLAVPDAENAASIYRSITKPFAHGGEIYKLWDVMTRPSDPVKAIAALDKEKPEIYKGIVAASRLDDCDYERDWSLGPRLLLPELAQMKSMAKYCTYLATADGDRGDLDSALQRLLVEDRIGRHISHDSILISSLVEFTVRSMVFNTTALIVNSRPIDGKTVRFLDKLTKSMDPPLPVIRSLEGEILSGYLTLRDYPLDAIYALASGGSFSKFKDPLDPEKRQVAITLFLNRIVELHKIWSKKATGREIVELTKDLDSRIESDSHPGGDLVQVIVPVYANAYGIYASVSSLTEMLRYVGKLLDNYVATGGKIDVSKPPTDSFTGMPYVVSLKQDALKVYSLGLNGKDDGGPTKPGYNTPIKGNDDFGFWITLNK